MATPPEFNGVIRLDVRDSIEDWTPYLAPKAPAGAPNILFILFDDTGLGAWEPFGGKIIMPTLEKIAKNGVIYTQWHTAALCSPTRGMLLTGRNHHLNGNSSITEGANGFPGQHARLPDECATVAQILQDAGWSTFWVGKNHNVPETDVALGSTKKQWPLAKGFDRFYGFIGGETNQFYPDLIADNHPVEQPYVEGYHLSKDLADQAIKMLKDQQASNPSKPWYMWFCPGANHAPHQILKDDKDRIIGQYYSGAASLDGDHKMDFSGGYEQYRQEVLDNMIAKGIMPEGTDPTPINPLEGIEHPSTDPGAGKPVMVANSDDFVQPWSAIGNNEEPPAGYTQGGFTVAGQELFTELMKVYAAFSTYTDEQVGRIVQYLEESGQIENTLIIYAADNGASGEGSPNGSVNENKFFNGYPDTLGENLDAVAALGTDDGITGNEGLNGLGGPDTYEHYPTGWAWATSTPFKMFKRYSQYAGGTCDPLVMSWPARINVEQMETNIRHQYHHATDIVPTILEACGLEMPQVYKGVQQYPLSGVSMCYTWDAEPDGPTKKVRQYYAMLGTRGLWEAGWKAVCLHTPLSGVGHFDQDAWELYHVDEDRAENTNLMANTADANYPEYQRKLGQLVDAWFEEAEKNLVLPLDDRDAAEQLGVERPTEEPPKNEYTYYPGASPVPESVAVNIRGRSYTIRAEVEIDPAACSGVIFAHGSRFGGHTLFVKDGAIHYVYNFLGVAVQELKTTPPVERLKGRARRNIDTRSVPDPTIVEVVFTWQGVGDNGESIGNTQLFVGGELKDTFANMQVQTGKFTLCGDGLCVGYDSADAVADYGEDVEPTNPFTGGTIKKVVITTSDPQQSIPARVLAGAFAAD